MANSYLIYQDKIPSTVASFFHEKEVFDYEINGDDKKITINVTQHVEAQKPLNGSLTIYFSNGKTSFNPQGKLHQICEECMSFIIQEASLGDFATINRCFTFRNVTTDEYNFILDEINNLPNVIIKPVGADVNVVNRSTVTGPYSNSVTITYYHTNTLTVQGILTSLILNVVSDITAVLDADKVSLGGAYLQVFGESATPLISQDLNDHLVERHHLSGTPYEKLILASISLVNSEIKLPEYSSVTHDVLRALEGVIGKRLHEAEAFHDAIPMIGNRFNIVTNPDGSTSFALLPRYSSRIASPIAIDKLNDAYNFYKAQRHSTFHSNFKLPILTRLINTKDEAAAIVLETIGQIRAILRNW